ncbi:MAG TPA: hypothetical protein VHO01_10970 [Jatrophihabitans sp.]|nr:hypothetical protein [Jatrophihabitans sp.]
MPPVAAFAMLLLVYRIMLRRRGRWTPFNARRAQLRSRSPGSSNGMLILAAVNLATLGWDVAVQAAALPRRLFGEATATLIPVVIVSMLLLLVVSRRLADVLLAALGVAAAFSGAYVQGGAAGLSAVVILTLLTLFLLGAARGFLRPLR